VLGLVMPAVVIAFILYGLLGEYCPAPGRTAATRPVARGHLYMTLEGIFGVAVDRFLVADHPFTIFGAFLQFSGAGKFFIDFSFSGWAANRRAQAATVVLAPFLLGGPSGSGVATT